MKPKKGKISPTQKDLTPTVFVVEDDHTLASAIQWLLSTVSLSCELFPDAQIFLNAYDANRNGCIIIDVRMPGMSGLELQERLNTLHNTLPIIIITGHGDIPTAVRAMQAGAFTFITKPFNDQTFLDHVQHAIEMNSKHDGQSNCAENYQRFLSLTPREREIMELVVSGKLNRQIAHECNISISTVELHRANVMQKMQTKTLVELVKTYMQLENANMLESQALPKT